jgi:hypothetical protein
MPSLPTSSQLHITIGVSPAENIDLRQDMKLIRAAILYADKTTLYSPNASLLQMALQLGGLSDNEQLRFMEMVVPYLKPSNEAAKIVDFLRRLSDYRVIQSPQGKALKATLLSQFADNWTEIKRVVDNIAASAGMNEIVTALDSGALEIHQFSTQSKNSDTMQFMADCVARASGKQLSRHEATAIQHRNSNMTKEFVDGVFSAIASGTTYPLFDADIGHLVYLAQKAGLVRFTDVSNQRARHIALAGDLLQRLPVFDQVAIKDILLIRGELDRHLTRFRRSVIEFASAVSSAPWDDDFGKESELLFRKEIAPAILDLEDEIRSNRLLEKLARQAIEKPLLLTPGAALSLALSQIPNLPAEIVASLGIGVSAAAVVYDAYKEWSDKQRTLERNGLFFYYQAGKRLDAQN